MRVSERVCTSVATRRIPTCIRFFFHRIRYAAAKDINDLKKNPPEEQGEEPNERENSILWLAYKAIISRLLLFSLSFVIWLHKGLNEKKMHFENTIFACVALFLFR